MLRILTIVALLAETASADGQVAMLPLDTGAKLEVYGQVLASEISKSLTDAKIDVVVVERNMTVPEVLLMVDGTIMAGKAGVIDLSIRLREKKTGKTVKTFPKQAPSLGKLDKATKELTAELLPVVRESIEALTKPPVVVEPPVKPPVQPPVQPPAAKPLLFGVSGNDPFRGALSDAINVWVNAAHRAPTAIDSLSLDAKTITKTVAGSNADRAIAFEVLSYRIWGDTVPMGKARVRVRIADAGQILFDRVVVTDTVVGDKAMAVDKFAARVADEVLAILSPHVRKVVPAWP